MDEKTASKMTYTVSGGALNSTQSNPSMDDWDSGMSSAYTATTVAV